MGIDHRLFAAPQSGYWPRTPRPHVPHPRGPRADAASGPLTLRRLKDHSRRYAGTGGRSEENHSTGFRPAFLDVDTAKVYESRFADGRPAPVHLLDGLPDEVVVERASSGRVVAVKASMIAGFVRAARFYSREEAAAALSPA